MWSSSIDHVYSSSLSDHAQYMNKYLQWNDKQINKLTLPKNDLLKIQENISIPYIAYGIV